MMLLMEAPAEEYKKRARDLLGLNV
jgi:hypothetical protein